MLLGLGQKVRQLHFFRSAVCRHKTMMKVTDRRSSRLDDFFYLNVLFFLVSFDSMPSLIGSFSFAPCRDKTKGKERQKLGQAKHLQR